MENKKPQISAATAEKLKAFRERLMTANKKQANVELTEQQREAAERIRQMFKVKRK